MAKKSNQKPSSRENGGSYNGTKYPYTVTPNALRKFLEMAPNKPRPSKVTTDTLKAWGLKNSNDYTILRVLKKLDLLGSSGEPTNNYNEFMKKGTGPAVLGSRIKVVYSDLFQNVTNPENAPSEELKNFFNINSGAGEQVISYQIQTFKALAAFATFGESDPLTQDLSDASDVNTNKSNSNPSNYPAIRFDLHIHLPENKTKSEYDAIIESIATHLYKVKE